MDMKKLKALRYSSILCINKAFKKQLGVQDNNRNVYAVTTDTAKEELYLWFNPQDLNGIVKPFNGKSVCIPVTCRNQLGWTKDYCIEMTLDTSCSRIICKKSTVKAREKPLNGLTMRDVEIYKKRRQGKKYADIGKEYDISLSCVRQIYVRTDRIFRKIQEGVNYELPEGFVFPDDLEDSSRPQITEMKER